MLKRIFGPIRKEVIGDGENYVIKSVTVCTLHQILLAQSVQREWDGRIWSVYGGKWEIQTKFKLVNLNGRPLRRRNHT
jgi:hypothetical protein